VLFIQISRLPLLQVGVGTPYSASVTIVSGDDSVRWTVSPIAHGYQRILSAEISIAEPPFPIETLGGEGGRVHPTARKYSSVDLRLRRKSPLETYAEDSMFNFS